MSNSIFPRPFYPAEQQKVGHKPLVTLFLSPKAGWRDKERKNTKRKVGASYISPAKFFL